MESARIRLITRADDAGTNATVNRAILEACREGIARNVSVMVTCPAAEEAAALLADVPGVCVGLHTTLNAEWDDVRWGPVLPPEQVPSLVDERGHFFASTRALHENRPSSEEVFAELQAQLDRARALGLDVRYADMHMGWGWVAAGLEPRFDQWCAREGILSHRPFNRRLPWPGDEGDPVEQVIGQLEAAEPGQYVLVAHPAYDTPEMRQLGHMGYPGERVATERDWQRRMFTDPRMLAYCRERGVTPIRYDEAVVP